MCIHAGGLIPALVLFISAEHTAAFAQLAAVGATVGGALASGALAALLVSSLGNPKDDELAKLAFEDGNVFLLEEGDEAE